jgi:hypothetical protein
MIQASPYTQYQQATANMQQQLQNLRMGGVGAMAQPQQANQPGMPTAFGPSGQSPTQPPQAGGY